MVLKFPLFKLIISFLPIVFMRILHYTFIFDKYLLLLQGYAVKMIRSKKCPVACRPPGHRDWLHC